MSARTMHPFPARMAPEIALEAIPSRELGVLTVLDPMCGSGTVLGVAVSEGHRAIGVDIDPLAVMMSRLTVTSIDAAALEDAIDAVATTARNTDGTNPWGDDEETGTFVDYWFGAAQQSQLRNLTTAIGALGDADVQLALRLAISRIIVTKSPQASLAADTAHSRPHRVQTDSAYDVVSGFEKSARQMSRMLAARRFLGSGTVDMGDARELASVDADTVDLAVTSPPYLNALDYLRGHKLALVWFGHKISDLRVRRSASIGAERGLDAPASATVAAIVDVIESEAVDVATLKRPMLERFAQDCVGFASQLRRTLKPDGKAVLVVGNSSLRGNYIRNDLIAQLAMEQAGFSLSDRYERDIPPTSRYMAMSSSGADLRITKRMRSEVVLTMGSP
jgi:tRNA G10  N-methylase Trm11